jgi:hypothetical protein
MGKRNKKQIPKAQLDIIKRKKRQDKILFTQYKYSDMQRVLVLPGAGRLF